MQGREHALVQMFGETVNKIILHRKKVMQQEPVPMFSIMIVTETQMQQIADVRYVWRETNKIVQQD